MKRISFNVFISSGGLRPHWGWNPLQWAALWRVQSINQLSVSCITGHTLPLILGFCSGRGPPAQLGTLSPLPWAAAPKGADHSWAGALMPSQRWSSESLSSSSRLCLQGIHAASQLEQTTGIIWRRLLQSASICPSISMSCAARGKAGSVGRAQQEVPSAAIIVSSCGRHHSNWSIWSASIDVLGKPQLAAGLKCRGHQKQALHHSRELIH